MSEIQKYSLETLISIASFCEKRNLVYFLDCGTLLGAVRHSGFIPWDDDIDILMPREDYEAFIEEYGDEGFRLFSYKNDKNYFYQYAKVSNCETLIRESAIPDIDGLGVNVDIFPLDGMPDALIPRRIHQDHLFFLSKLRALTLRLRRKAPRPLKGLFRWRWIIGSIERTARRYPYGSTAFSGNIAATTIRHKEIPSECFASSEKMGFEGHSFSVPSGYGKYLTLLYGDYMKLPPEEKRVTRHSFTAYKI